MDVQKYIKCIFDKRLKNIWINFETINTTRLNIFYVPKTSPKLLCMQM